MSTVKHMISSGLGDTLGGIHEEAPIERSRGQRADSAGRCGGRNTGVRKPRASDGGSHLMARGGDQSSANECGVAAILWYRRVWRGCGSLASERYGDLE